MGVRRCPRHASQRIGHLDDIGLYSLLSAEEFVIVRFQRSFFEQFRFGSLGFPTSARIQLSTQPSADSSRSGSTDNFNRKDRMYSTLPANNRRTSQTTDSCEEKAVHWSDDEDAVALNGDWGTPEAPRRSISSQSQVK